MNTHATVINNTKSSESQTSHCIPSDISTTHTLEHSTRNIQPPDENISKSSESHASIWTFDESIHSILSDMPATTQSLEHPGRNIQPPDENISKSSESQTSIWTFDESIHCIPSDISITTMSSDHSERDNQPPVENMSELSDIEAVKNILPELREEPFTDPNVHVNYSSKNLALYAKSFFLSRDGNCYSEGNWVIPNLFGIGACPFDPDIIGSEKNSLIILSKIGIRHFCCLQKEYPNDPKVRSRIPPFYDEFENSIYPNRVLLGLDENWTIPTVNIFPITDCGVESDSKIDAITDIYVQNIRAGEPCFAHCWGGHGRAGTFAAIVLIKLYKLKYDQVLKYMQAVHDCRITWVECTCPQMPTQYQQIKRFADKYST